MAKGTRLSEDWTLPEDWKQWAEEYSPGLNVKAIADEFKDYWISKSGQNATKTNWCATWRNWIRKTIQYNGVQNKEISKSEQHKPQSHKLVKTKPISNKDWRDKRALAAERLSELKQALK